MTVGQDLAHQTHLPPPGQVGARYPPRRKPMTDIVSMDFDPTTVVLAHGAFADSSGWNGVVQQLQRAIDPAAFHTATLSRVLAA